MKTITLDVGPGQLQASNGSPFEIPVSEWKSINDYLVNVAAASPQTTASTVSVIPAFADLHGVAGRWRPATLPNIVKLATGIYSYGASTVAGQFPKLQVLLVTMQSETPANSVATFQTLMTEIQATAQQNTTTASGIVQDLQTLDTAVQVIKKQAEDYISDSMSMSDPGGSGSAGLEAISNLASAMSQLASIMSAIGTPPQADIERIRGAWASITDDLGGFQSTVDDEIATGDPFLAELNLDVAISEWSHLATEAYLAAQGVGSL
jgi:hypothetical protein